jgi:serpin B
MNFPPVFLSSAIESMASLATDLDSFGAKLFSTISHQNNGRNVFLSPASISLAVSMCAVGARHETLQQMLHVLEVSSIEQLTDIAEQIMHAFPPAEQDEPPMKQSTDPDAPSRAVFHRMGSFIPLQVKLANRLYAQKEYRIQQEYLDLIQKFFHSNIKLEDFKNESTKAIQTINAWVEKRTDQQIRDVLSAKDVTQDTRLVLINCIYFKVNL